ncbi:MAG: M18 family aminopeptidase [Actinomycetota bacterium]
MSPHNDSSIDSLKRHLDASVSPAHSVRHVVERLTNSGFHTVASGELSSTLPNLGIVADAGFACAWIRGSGQPSFRIVGAHTDSPTLKIKPRPDISNVGWKQLAVEIYGGILNNSWLDRDLGIAGRVVLGNGEVRLFDSVDPVARIPQLAVHLDREVNERGLILDKQLHLTPVWGVGDVSPDGFKSWVAHELHIDPEFVAAWDLGLYDVTPAAIIGADRSMLASGRLDNQVSCWAAVEALVSIAEQQVSPQSTSVVVLFDHEEVGSQSTHGADGPRLEWILEALSASDRVGFSDALSRSHCLSVDNAHAVHPNYPERHEPMHRPAPNSGPVLKINANQRYASTPESTVPFLEACRQTGISHQLFVSRNSQPCGSTIGPITATRLGIPTADIGVAQLSMHSAREVCGAEDPSAMKTVLTAYLAGTT